MDFADLVNATAARSGIHLPDGVTALLPDTDLESLLRTVSPSLAKSILNLSKDGVILPKQKLVKILQRSCVTAKNMNDQLPETMKKLQTLQGDITETTSRIPVSTQGTSTTTTGTATSTNKNNASPTSDTSSHQPIITHEQYEKALSEANATHKPVTITGNSYNGPLGELLTGLTAAVRNKSDAEHIAADLFHSDGVHVHNEPQHSSYTNNDHHHYSNYEHYNQLGDQHSSNYSHHGYHHHSNYEQSYNYSPEYHNYQTYHETAQNYSPVSSYASYQAPLSNPETAYQVDDSYTQTSYSGTDTSYSPATTDHTMAHNHHYGNGHNTHHYSTHSEHSGHHYSTHHHAEAHEPNYTALNSPDADTPVVAGSDNPYGPDDTSSTTASTSSTFSTSSTEHHPIADHTATGHNTEHHSSAHHMSHAPHHPHPATSGEDSIDSITAAATRDITDVYQNTVLDGLTSTNDVENITATANDNVNNASESFTSASTNTDTPDQLSHISNSTDTYASNPYADNLDSGHDAHHHDAHQHREDQQSHDHDAHHHGEHQHGSHHQHHSATADYAADHAAGTHHSVTELDEHNHFLINDHPIDTSKAPQLNLLLQAMSDSDQPLSVSDAFAKIGNPLPMDTEDPGELIGPSALAAGDIVSFDGNNALYLGNDLVYLDGKVIPLDEAINNVPGFKGFFHPKLVDSLNNGPAPIL